MYNTDFTSIRSAFATLMGLQQLLVVCALCEKEE